MAVNLTPVRGVQAAINVTPMIDVLLVLLIIFMAISPVRSTGVSALLPEGEKSGAAREAPVILEIARDGAYAINSRSIGVQDLAAALLNVYKDRADRVLFLRAAPELEFAVVAAAIDISRQAGIERVALMPRY